VLSAAMCMAAMAQPPAPAPAPAPPPPAAAANAPDDDFIEFLGSDDVGDTAWWEFLNKSAAPGEEDPPPAPAPAPPPPPDAKQ